MDTYTEVSEVVNTLHNSFNELRTTAERRYELYQMRKEPYVPEEIAREGKVRMLSPLVIYAAQTIRADLMMNPTELTVIPLARDKGGAVTKKAAEKAENLERALAILWGRLNEGRRIDREIVWHQLVSPYGVLMLEFNDLVLPDQAEDMDDKTYVDLIDACKDDWLPWNVYIPNPLTCSWLERSGQPVLFARKYKLLVRDLLTTYKRAANSTEPDANLFYENGHFRFVSDDVPEHRYNLAGAFEEVDVLWLDDGQHIYQAVMNPGANDGQGDNGMLLAKVPNPIGRPTGFVVPGNTNPSRAVEDRYEPFLLPLMQSVSEVNDLRSMRATAARNLAGPNTYIPIDPEVVKLYASRGEQLPREVKWKKNVTHYTLGPVEILPSELSGDYDKLEANINEEMQRYLPSPFVNVVDPAVLKAATATSILHAAEAGIRMYGPLTSALDATVRDILTSIIYSIRTNFSNEDFKMFAMGDEVAHGKGLKEGTMQRLNEDAIDFSYKLIVKTRSMSRAQASAQYEATLAQWILPDGSKGPATLEDLMDAANINDPVAQRMKLAKEGILNTIDPWIQEMAIASTREEIMLDSGIDLPLLGGGLGGTPATDAMSTEQPSEGGGQAKNPARLPNQAQRMDAPLISGPEGGSSGGPL